jgi:pyruvate dehydrogenase E1 component alpha subunit
MPSKDKTSSRTRKSRGRKKNARARAAATSAGKAPASAVNQSSAPAAVLTGQKLQQLYFSMLKCQMLARRVQEISTTQPIAPGREAVLVGVLAHAQSEDYTALAHNAFLAGLLRGESLKALLTQQLSSTPGPAPYQGKVSPAQFALIRGMGQAKELLGSGKAVLVFCGQDPAALDFQQEALALAAKYKAPMVCLIETNLSSLAAEEKQRRGKKKPARYQFPEIAVDGADVVAIFRVAQEAIRRARTGHGPSLIKCVMPEEVSVEQADGTVTAHDPLAFMEQYLRRRNLWAEEWREKIADEFQRELETALRNETCSSPRRH